MSEPSSELSERLVPQKTVLVVDDDSSNLRFVDRILKKNGFNVLTADDGEEALAIFKNPDSPKIDLIFTDNNMPNKTGVDLIKDVRQTDSQIPIILTSGIFFAGLSGEEQQKKLVEIGATAGLSKPYNSFQEIIDITNRLLKD